MMDTIILCGDKFSGEALLNALSGVDCQFQSMQSFTKRDLQSSPESFKNVKYVFSSWYMPLFTEEEIELFFPSLKAVFYSAGSVKYFAEPFLKKGVRIFSSARVNGIPVAEFAAAQIILANKGFFQSQRAYHWPIWRQGFNKCRQLSAIKGGNYGATVGLIGCGAVGSHVVELLRPLDLFVQVYDPFLSDEIASRIGVKKVELSQLFQTSDVISNHLPDTIETRGMINYDVLSKMKPTATFINTGRGLQVDEKALCRVMRKNHNMCALLDVTSHEPLFPWSSLYFRKNVFLTPHIAGSLGNEYNRLVKTMVEAFCDFLREKGNVSEVFLYQLESMS